MSDVTILGLSGSLRAGSLNTALLRAAAGLLPAGARLELYDYSDVPLYNGDQSTPDSVTRLEEVIRSADAVLFATPEYNYSVPGVLKNAIDHASRPAYHSVFRDKPCGILSATASFVGGARAQQHLKTILLGMGAALFPWPELLVGGAHGRFTGGQLTDEVTEKFLRGYVEGMVSWVQRMPAGATSRRS